MNLSLALGILVASGPAAPGSAFVPSAPARRAALAAVGGGMIEPPRDDSAGASGAAGAADGDDAADEAGDLSNAPDPREIYEREKAQFVAKLGRDIDFDPWDPNPYIRPRPGKYGWKDEDDERGRLAAREASDAAIAAAGQVMSDAEREENLDAIRNLRQTVVPEAMAMRDQLEAAKASSEANAREEKDPWFQLNQRLADAVKYGAGDPDHLRAAHL